MPSTFKKILVANRGEIAIRVLRAANEINIKTIAIYTHEDRYSLHRYKADESYQIGANQDPLKPYLDMDCILNVAIENGADAIHPGYGFLSENIEFAKKCRAAGIEFIGPSEQAMLKLGNKINAKKLADTLGIPTIKSVTKKLNNDDEILEAANYVGYPVMVKATSGGGGRGMRVVFKEENLVRSYREAQSESKKAFGDDSMFIEKYIVDPKHIEIQILGDKKGNIIHLFERDCSVQRRFQKVVEIAPAQNLDSKTKNALYDNALKIAKAVDYYNAGTVEFLVDAEENIYFIEVNPRIQVEHTVTEEITGIDIVRAQILIGMGYKIHEHPIRIPAQKDIKISGVAIQCRITTENPADDFKPDFGTLVAYRSAAGFGIRLDAGSAYAGSQISPFFDSMLVKVTAWGRTLKGSSNRMHRALREFRIRGVKTNIGFLMNLIRDEAFMNGDIHVNYIKQNPQLIALPHIRNRGTKLLRYLGDTIVNGNTDIKAINENAIFRTPIIPNFEHKPIKNGTKQLLTALGPKKFAQWLKNEKKIHFTDTTMRDAHQSLLATRVRGQDMMAVANSFAHFHGNEVFSMEVWGGATFDVCLRFLKEDPWERLAKFRAAMPNTLLQMLLRGSNAVGYKAYPDNLVTSFVKEAWNDGNGIDIFRIFDSLNWVEAMKTSIHAVLEHTNAIAEACICYTGNLADPEEKKYTLDYYIDLAKALEKEGAHILCIKDMAGLLRPSAAKILFKALKKAIKIPIHLHTHDTSSIQSATYLNAINAGVDVVDVALSSMSGMTSQPNFNSIVAMLDGHERANKIDLSSLNQFSNYWESVRTFYYPFETELKAGTSEVYQHEIPGGQYSNLRPQARGLGLEDQFETIKKNYIIANKLFGGLVKVTPSSKVVGDMAMFMTSNAFTEADILEKGHEIDFPDSVKSLMRGDLGQTIGGFPPKIQKIILKDEKPFTDRPNEHLTPLDWQVEAKNYLDKYNLKPTQKDLLSFKLYPRVYDDYFHFRTQFGVVDLLPTRAFFYGLKPNEEIMVEIDRGKTLLIKLLNIGEPNMEGIRQIVFQLNGQHRTIRVKDNNIESSVIENRKAMGDLEIGSPLQGKLFQILVKKGDKVKKGTPLFVIEAMKMENTITATRDAEIDGIFLQEGALINQNDLIVSLK